MKDRDQEGFDSTTDCDGESRLCHKADVVHRNRCQESLNIRNLETAAIKTSSALLPSFIMASLTMCLFCWSPVLGQPSSKIEIDQTESLSSAGSDIQLAQSIENVTNPARLTTEQLALVAKADRLTAFREFDQAIATYRLVLKSSENAQVRERLGKALYFSGKMPEAIVELRAAVDLDKDNAEYLQELAWLLMQNKDFKEAVRYANMSVSLLPDQADAYILLGYSYGNLNKIDSALTALDKAIELNPNNPLSYVYKGDVLFSANRYKDALEAFRQAEELGGNPVEVYIGMGNCHDKLGDKKARMNCYKKAVIVAPEDADAHGHLGMAYLQAGHMVSAFKHGLVATSIRLDKSWSGYMGMIIAGWAGLFIIFGIIFAAMFAGSNFKPQPGETVIGSFQLIFFKDRPGRFVVTDRRIVFVPELFSQSFGTTRISIEREGIESVVAENQHGNRAVTIKSKSETMHRFTMPQLVYDPLLELLRAHNLLVASQDAGSMADESSDDISMVDLKAAASLVQESSPPESESEGDSTSGTTIDAAEALSVSSDSEKDATRASAAEIAATDISAEQPTAAASEEQNDAVKEDHPSAAEIGAKDVSSEEPTAAASEQQNNADKEALTTVPSETAMLSESIEETAGMESVTAAREVDAENIESESPAISKAKSDDAVENSQAVEPERLAELQASEVSGSTQLESTESEPAAVSQEIAERTQTSADGTEAESKGASTDSEQDISADSTGGEQAVSPTDSMDEESVSSQASPDDQDEKDNSKS